MKDLSIYGVNPAKGRSYENIVYALALVYNILQRRVEAYLALYDLSAVQFNLLMLAAYQNNGDGINQVELSKRLIASASNITKLVEKSVKAGLVLRKQNLRNRRENIIRIAPKGQELIAVVWPEYDRLVRAMTDKIPPDQQQTAEKILNEWFELLQKENK